MTEGVSDKVSMGETTDQEPETLPVYEVAQTGLDEVQVRKLAEAFGIPADEMILSDGVVSYVDRAGYLGIPTTQVSDPDIVDKLRAVSATGNPDTRLRLQSIDLANLENLSAMDDETAVRRCSEAFASVGLELGSAEPVAGSTRFTASFVDGNRAGTTVSRELQTRVNYQFSDGRGHPLIGPGAQAVVTFDGAGKVVQLHLATAKFRDGPTVRVFSQDEARWREGLNSHLTHGSTCGWSTGAHRCGRTAA